MAAIIGFLLFVIGWALLAFGTIAPGYLGAALWQSLLGVVLTAGGYAMSEYSGSGCLVGLISLLMAALGILLLVASLASLIVGFGIYSTVGAILRIVVGIIFIVVAFLMLQMRGALASDDSVDDF